jgi:heat shock protein HslJ
MTQTHHPYASGLRHWVSALCIAASVCALTTIGCASSQSTPEVVVIDRDWIDGPWDVHSVRGVEIEDLFGDARLRDTVSFEIAERRVSGYSGVNQFNASLEFASGDPQDAFVLGPVMSSRMAGPPAAMSGEARVLEALRATTRFVPVPGTPERLVFLDADGEATMALIRPE